MRLSPRVIALTAAALLAAPLTGAIAQQTPAPDTDTGQTLQAVTGGEVKCVKGKATIYDCSNVDLVSYLPPSAMGPTS